MEKQSTKLGIRFYGCLYVIKTRECLCTTKCLCTNRYFYTEKAWSVLLVFFLFHVFVCIFVCSRKYGWAVEGTGLLNRRTFLMYHGFKSRCFHFEACFRAFPFVRRTYVCILLSNLWGYNSMVECLPCTQEAIGSSPFISIFCSAKAYEFSVATQTQKRAYIVQWKNTSLVRQRSSVQFWL